MFVLSRSSCSSRSPFFENRARPLHAFLLLSPFRGPRSRPQTPTAIGAYGNWPEHAHVGVWRVNMFALPCFDIGNERWTTSGFLTRLSNGGPPQVPGTHAGTRGAGEFDGIIAAVKEDEIYYHRDQCDMITMILRLAAEPAWRYERGRQTTPAADRNRRIGGCGTRVIDQACPWERVLCCYFSAPGVLCHFEKAHPSAHGVCYYRATQKKKKSN